MSCSQGRPNFSPMSSPMARNRRPPQSWRSWRITAGVAAAAGQRRSVSHSRKSESNTITGSPRAKAAAACLIRLEVSIALTPRRGQTTPFFSVRTVHLLSCKTTMTHHRCVLQIVQTILCVMPHPSPCAHFWLV